MMMRCNKGHAAKQELAHVSQCCDFTDEPILPADMVITKHYIVFQTVVAPSDRNIELSDSALMHIVRQHGGNTSVHQCSCRRKLNYH